MFIVCKVQAQLEHEHENEHKQEREHVHEVQQSGVRNQDIFVTFDDFEIAIEEVKFKTRQRCWNIRVS